MKGHTQKTIYNYKYFYHCVFLKACWPIYIWIQELLSFSYWNLLFWARTEDRKAPYGPLTELAPQHLLPLISSSCHWTLTLQTRRWATETGVTDINAERDGEWSKLTAQRAVSTGWHCLSWPFSCSPQHSKDRIPSSQPYLKTHNLSDYSFFNVSILGNIRNMAAPSTGVFF